MLRRIFTLLLFVQGTFMFALAQNTFRYKANIDPISQSGFYKIYLYPQLVAKSRTDLADLRIMDEKKSFVPYVRLQSLPSIKKDFINFPVVQSSDDSDSITFVVVENKSSLLIRSLWLRLKNTAVSRKADILGSDDMQKWFAIEEGVPLNQASAENTDSYSQSLSFPASSYKYFKVNVNNKQKSPIKILQAGIYSANSTAPAFTLLPKPQTSRKDSIGKITFLRLRFNDKFQVNKLVIPVSHPKYFRRIVSIFEINGKEKILLTQAVLSSEGKPELIFSSKTTQLELQIQNEDNPPLSIAQIQAWQLNEYVVAYLESGKTYQLLTGDKKAGQPSYELSYFTDSALATAAEIKHTQLQRNPLLKTTPIKKEKNNTILLWAAIVLALALLSFSTWRMMASMKKPD